MLIMGLGTLGGGIASAKWFLSHGAKVTVTDLRTERELKSSIGEFHLSKKKVVGKGVMTRHNTRGKTVRFVLGRHRAEDFKENDIIVVNPAVPRESPYLAIAKKAGKTIVNDAKIFFDAVPNPIIAVTGTRGKTTTTNWIAHFLKSRHKNSIAGGNSSRVALLSVIGKLSSGGGSAFDGKDKKTPVVLELSSWQLELLDEARRGPDVAVITNIFPDHLNRYTNVRDYASAKANIFSRQTPSQKLILNLDNPWTKFFLSKRPKSEKYFISFKKLPTGRNGLCVLPAIPSRHEAIKNMGIGASKGGTEKVLCYSIAPQEEIAFVYRGKTRQVFSSKMVRKIKTLGEHNMYNFLAAALAAHLMGISWGAIEKRVETLPQIPLRQEVILRGKNLLVVNDSAGTSPDATIAAIRRFKNQGNIILITGGTDKNLEFKGLAREIQESIAPEHLFLLDGSATKKLISELKRVRYFKNTKPRLFESLQEIMQSLRNMNLVRIYENAVVLFSPGAASFEKFKNEFDRGEQFNTLIKRYGSELAGGLTFLRLSGSKEHWR